MAVGRLRVGFVALGAYDMLPAIVRRFRRTVPAVEVELDDCGHEFPLDRLTSGALDIALARGPAK
jgi:DNA-binding transcriptional LysR family regulator